MTRRFVVVGRTATASAGFSLEDLPGSSGRLDVLLRCLRAGLLVSHGSRRDTVVYLVLLGGPDAPRTVRVDGAAAKFVRPDERSLALRVRKALGGAHPPSNPVRSEPPHRVTEIAMVSNGFLSCRHGMSLADGGVEAVLRDAGTGARYLLEQGAPDLRDTPIDEANPVFFLGDHLGLDAATRDLLLGGGATPIGLGPVSVHAEDAIVLVANELDRRRASGAPPGAEGGEFGPLLAPG